MNRLTPLLALAAALFSACGTPHGQQEPINFGNQPVSAGYPNPGGEYPGGETPDPAAGRKGGRGGSSCICCCDGCDCCCDCGDCCDCT